MEGPKSYTPTMEASADASSKLVHFSRTSKEDTLRESATSSRTTTSFPQTLLNCFSFLRSRRSRHQCKTSTIHFSEQKDFIAPTISTVSLKMEPSIKAEPYNWPHGCDFNPTTTALVIIDMQRDCKSYPLSIFILFQAYPTFKTSCQYHSKRTLKPKTSITNHWLSFPLIIFSFLLVTFMHIIVLKHCIGILLTVFSL